MKFNTFATENISSSRRERVENKRKPLMINGVPVSPIGYPDCENLFNDDIDSYSFDLTDN